MARADFQPDVFADFVASHGYGDATEAGIDKGLEYMQDGMDYAEAAAEVVTLAQSSPSLDLLFPKDEEA